MRASVLLFASLTIPALVSPRVLRAEPGLLTSLTSPIAADLGTSNDSTWFAAWVGNAIGSPTFATSDGSLALFVAATNRGVDSPSIFNGDPAAPTLHTANDDHATGGSPVPAPHDHDGAITSTPEPSTFILAASGLTALVGVARRRRRLHGA